jgi:uncharacterized protein
MYYDGVGVSPDDALSLKWFAKAADQGDAKARSYLGLMYKTGRGVEKNYVSAYMWFDLAAGGGDAASRENIGELSKDMTVEQLRQANQLKQEWLATH